MSRRLFKMCPSCRRYHEVGERAEGSVDCAAAARSDEDRDREREGTRTSRERPHRTEQQATPELPRELLPTALRALALRLVEGEGERGDQGVQSVLQAILDATARRDS